MKPHKISTHSSYLDDCYFIFFNWLSDWVEILWGVTKFLFKPMLKVSVFYLEKQKSIILKKIFLSHCQYQNNFFLFTDPIFSEGFGTALLPADRSVWRRTLKSISIKNWQKFTNFALLTIHLVSVWLWSFFNVGQN